VPEVPGGQQQAGDKNDHENTDVEHRLDFLVFTGSKNTLSKLVAGINKKSGPKDRCFCLRKSELTKA
jgi:hypothetical protein